MNLLDLIDDLNKIRYDNFDDIIYPFNNNQIKLFEKYTNGKVIEIKDLYWSSIEKNINILNYDEKVKGIYINDIDRGVGDWKIIDNLLRKKFPNFESIYVNQMFGKDNISESKAKLVFLYSSQFNQFDFNNLIYRKKIYKEGFQDYECENDPGLIIFINIFNINGQINVLIGDDIYFDENNYMQDFEKNKYFDKLYEKNKKVDFSKIRI